MTTFSFQPIGPLLPASVLYIERGAERQAIQALCDPNPAFLLVTEARQQGKTSFINYLSQHNNLSQCCFITINAGRLPINISEIDWYRLLYSEVQRQLAPYVFGIDSLPECTSQEQWRNIMVEIGQAARAKQRLIVIALDELGRLPTTWRESFLSSLCEVRDSRANTPAFLAITFLFVGSFRPEAMITDWNISPFNKAKPLALDDFESHHVAELLQRASVPAVTAETVLPHLMYWTDGQPYLIQSLCETLFSDGLSDVSEKEISRVVYGLERRDRVHLPPIFEKLRTSKRLCNYAERILNGEEVEHAPANIKRQAELSSLGLIKEQKSTGRCIIRNPIYARAFRRFLIDQRDQMTNEDRNIDCQHLTQLHTIKQTYHQQLELQVAKFGLYVPTYMAVELREISQEVAKLHEQLKVLGC